MAKCKVDCCEREVTARGWCQSHYMHWYQSGIEPTRPLDARKVRPKSGIKCKVDGCDRKERVRGWCTQHYAGWRRTGVEPSVPVNFYEMHGHDGQEKSATYLSWDTMVQRCTNPKSAAYEFYGARGIKVCDRWRESFPAFLADMGERPVGLTLDRKDNSGNYEPGNCRWATREEQMRNTRANVFTVELVLDLRRSVAAGKSIASWARENGISKSTATYAANGETWRGIEDSAR